MAAPPTFTVFSCANDAFIIKAAATSMAVLLTDFIIVFLRK
jgi:hypothetical protein